MMDSNIMTPHLTGAIGENYTRSFLEKHGYKILDTNYRIKGGEIDILALKDGVLRAVEVKSRGTDALTSPSDAITKSKREFIIRTAGEYMRRKNLDIDCVFDVAEVWVNKGKVVDFEYIQRAFTA